MAKNGRIAIMKSIRVLERVQETIENPALLEVSRLKPTAFTRCERGRMGFADALCFMLDMCKTTLQTRLNRFYRLAKEETPISQPAFTQLRANFSHKPFEVMVRDLVREEYSGEEALPTWRGYHLFATDGSYLQLPFTLTLAKEFGVRGGGDRPGAGISVLYDVLHGWVLDAEIDRTDRNERKSLERHIDFLVNELPHIVKHALLLLDRGYPSHDLVQKCTKAGLKFVVRCTNKQSFKAADMAPVGDSVVKLRDGQVVRVVKFLLDSGEIETLVTNVFDIPESEFPSLYSMRWGVETMYHELKRIIGVEKFSGKTPNSIRQDFWASMVLLNVAAVFQNEADEAIAQRHKGKPVKHVYRARTSDLIVTLRDRLIFASLCGHPKLTNWELANIMRELSRAVSPRRPGRHFPRRPRPLAAARFNLKSVL